MKVYEKRTYSVKVGQMPEVIRLYSELGWPALEAGGFSNKLVGYFVSDTGPLHQLIHIWRFMGFPMASCRLAESIAGLRQGTHLGSLTLLFCFCCYLCPA